MTFSLLHQTNTGKFVPFCTKQSRFKAKLSLIQPQLKDTSMSKTI